MKINFGLKEQVEDKNIISYISSVFAETLNSSNKSTYAQTIKTIANQCRIVFYQLLSLTKGASISDFNNYDEGENDWVPELCDDQPEEWYRLPQGNV